MKRFWSVLLVGVLGCLCVGCQQRRIEQPTEKEVKEDLNNQQEMMKAVESGRKG